MLKSIGLLVLAFQVQFVLHAQSSPAVLAQSNSKLGTVVQDYNVTANNFLDGLTHVASEFRVEIGIEWVNTPAANTQFALSWKSASVEQILETIVQSQPGYQMHISEGIVHVYSTDIPREQDFINLRVKSFIVHDQVVQVAERRLSYLVKLTTAPSESGTRGGIGGSLATRVNEPRISVQLDNVTVQDVLDSLIRASAKKIWVVTFVDNAVPTATGFRRTLTLWSKLPVPDNEQPVWNMFGWDEPLPWAGLDVR